jgi:hypothetical protein
VGISAVTVAVISPTRSGVRSSVVVSRNSLCVDSGVGVGVLSLIVVAGVVVSSTPAVVAGGVVAPTGVAGVAGAADPAAIGTVRRLTPTIIATAATRHADIAGVTLRSPIMIPNADPAAVREQTGVGTGGG